MVIENLDNKSLDLQDLLIDQQSNSLTDYLSLSFENIGNQTKVSVTTVEESPITYSSTLNGMSATDLQSLLDSDFYIL